MPVAALATIVIGAEIGAGTIVGGLMMASGGLSLVGQATGNKALTELGAVAGIAAGGYGLYSSLSSTASMAGVIDGAFTPVAEGLATEGAATNAAGLAAQNIGAPAAAADIGDSLFATAPAVPESAIPGGAPIPGGPPAPSGPPPAPGGLVYDAMQTPTPGVLDLPATQAGPPQPGSVQWRAMVSTPDADPGIVEKLWGAFQKLDPTTKLAISNFVAKGMGTVSDFVGPKADLVRAQAGLSASQTALLQQQFSNMQGSVGRVTMPSLTNRVA